MNHSENIVFIVTLGQTGSSAFAELITELGMTIHNKYRGHKDFFENADLIRENKRMIGDDTAPKDMNRPPMKPRTDLTGLLKDPRTVVVFQEWYQSYPTAKFIFLMRNPYDIELDKFLYSKRPDILRERIFFFYKALAECDPARRLYVHYDQLSFDFQRTMRRVAEFCGLPYRPLKGWTPKYYGKFIHNSDSTPGR